MAARFVEACSGWLSGRGPAIGTRGQRRAHALEALLAYGYLAPAFVLLLIFTLGPFVYVFYASVLHAPGAATQRFVGLDNYRYLFDPLSGFPQALVTTCLFVVGVVPAGVILSLVCALLLRERVRGWAVFRLLFFLPFVTPALPTSIIWLWIFNPQCGLLNALLRQLHLPALGWIDDPTWAMPAVIIYSLWQADIAPVPSAMPRWWRWPSSSPSRSIGCSSPRLSRAAG